jgi:YD repeat-containing protein
MRAKEFITETESYQPPVLKVGDKILKGKFKNSPAEIKGFTVDKHNQPILKTNKGEVQLFKPRIAKLIAKDIVENQKITELFDKASGFEIEYEQTANSVYATAYDRQGRVISITIGPGGIPGAVDIEFTRGGSFDITGKGDAARVFGTVINVIEYYLNNIDAPKYIIFHGKEGSRGSLYQALINRLASKVGYIQQDPKNAPEDIADYMFSTDGIFLLKRIS